MAETVVDEESDEQELSSFLTAPKHSSTHSEESCQLECC